MDLSGISKTQLYSLATNHFGRRLFEMIFAAKTYDEIGALYVRLRQDGLIIVSEDKYYLCEEAKVFAQPVIEEIENISTELTFVLQKFVNTYEPDAEFHVSSTAVFWCGKYSNYYRFNIVDYGNELVIKARFSSELIAIDGENLCLQVFFLKTPIKEQFVYIEETLLAHMKWSKKMNDIDRRLNG